MRLIYAQGFSKSEKLEWKPVIFNNVVQSMRVIFDAMHDCGIEFENKENEVRKEVKPWDIWLDGWVDGLIYKSCLGVGIGKMRMRE